MPRKQHIFHFIYKTTCLITNNFYIGMHSTSNMEDGYMGSGKRIRYSLNKHGVENHKIEHLEFFQSRNELAKREAELVNESLLHDSHCMNLKFGGEGGWDAAKKYNKGRPRSDKTKLAISLGIKHFLKYDSRALYFLQQASNTLKQAHKDGKIKYDTFTGKFHSEETKRKISLANSKMKGIKNSQYGTCWIYSLIKQRNMKIKKDQLDSYQENGWIKGRKMGFNSLIPNI